MMCQIRFFHGVTRFVFIAVALGLAVAAFGARSSAAVPELVPVTIVSSPDNATVLIDGSVRGSTPVLVRLRPGRHVARFEAEGVAPVFFHFETDETPAEKFFKLPQDLVPVLAESSPTGAVVTLDGVYSGVTPLLLPAVAPGKHVFEFSLPGCKNQIREMTLAAPRPVKVFAELESATATIAVFSVPSGASVSVNGIDRGQTPVEIGGIAEGGAAVDIALPGYAAWHGVTGPLSAGSVFRIDASLEALPSVVRVETVPDGARVYIDNALAGRSPLVSTNTPGHHRLRVDMEGHASLARNVEFRPGGVSVEEFRLRRTGGNFSVSTAPAGTGVSVDGKPRGRTHGETGMEDPVSLVFVVSNLEAGAHVAEFSRPGWETKKVEFSIDADRDTTMDTVELVRLFIPDFQIETRSTGVVKGVFIENAPDRYRIEVSPGVVRAIPKSEILRVAILRHGLESEPEQSK